MMKKILCLLLIIMAVLALSSCGWYEKSIRVTAQINTGSLPLPDESGEKEKTDETKDPNATNGPDYTVPPSTENRGDDEKPDKTQIPDEHEKTEENTTHGPDYDGNGNKIPDALESADNNDPSITEPSITDVPTPPPAPTASPEASTSPEADPAYLNELFSSYVDFCNEIGTFNSNDDLDPIAIFDFYRYDIVVGDESKGMQTDGDGDEYELIIQTYDMILLDEITRNMLGRCYNYDALEGRVVHLLGTETTFSFDDNGNVIGTMKIYGGAGYGPRPYLEYVDYEQNGNEFIINAQYMEMDDDDEFYPVKDYVISVTFVNDRYVMNSYIEKA